MKNKIKIELQSVAELLAGYEGMEGESFKLLRALGLILRLEAALDRLEHKRKCNASQVKQLVKKNKGLNKGLRTITSKRRPFGVLTGDVAERLIKDSLKVTLPDSGYVDEATCKWMDDYFKGGM